MVFQYTRAVYDFHASHPDEVSLRKGDVAQVIKQLDANWIFGIVHGLEGAFPVSFVEPILLPAIESGQRVFVAIENFDGGETGDLCLQRGNIVIGTVAVDQNWWEGFEILTRHSGLFPLTHVEELHVGSCDSLSFQDKESSQGKQAASGICEAVVISNLCAQLEGELDLIEGEVVEVLHFLDDGFAFGRCKGRTGQFPLSFVQVRDEVSEQISSNHCSKQLDEIYFIAKHDSIINPSVQTQYSPTITNNGSVKTKKSHSRKGSYTQANTRSHDSYVMPYVQARYNFTAVNKGELSFNVNEIITLISHIDDDWAEGEINGKRGIFPTSYVNIIVDCQLAEDTKLVHAASAGNFSPEIYGRVLYDFMAENSDELSLCEGDTVTILEQVGADWYLARHDDERVGRCPVNYIEVFACEPLYGITSSSSAHPNLKSNQEDSTINSSFSIYSNLQQKPSIKPKPKGNAPMNLLCGVNNLSDFKSKEFQTDWKNSGSHIPLKLQNHSNTKMSLDEVVEHELQRARETTHAKENINNEALVANYQNSFAGPQSVAVLDLKTKELFRAKQGFNRTQTQHQTFDSLVPTSKILRPNSLSINEDSKSSIEKSQSKPMPLLKFSPAKPKIIPKRPAPPRPTSKTAVRSQSHNDLMMFSPDRLVSSDSLVARSSTPTVDPAMNLPTSPICFNIVKSETDSTHLDEKHREKRQRVIAELIQTESDYVNCLVLCLKTFSSRTKLCPQALDLETLFGNADQVVELSQRLLGLIEQNVEAKPFEMQCVGKCFIELKEQFQRVYAPYCRNHDNVIAVLEKFEGNAEISEFIQAALNEIRQQLHVFDLHSILIRPVQRILKYPLLLSELERATDEAHTDKHHLLAAISIMTNVASYINEYKRRKDLVFKYKQETDVKFSDKMSRLTMHSTMKKLSRISRKMVGIQTVDEGFNHEEQRFKTLDNTIRNLARDISRYIEQCREVLECRELVAVNIAEIYMKEAPELEIQKFCDVHNQILQAFFREFKQEIESDILPPLNSLLLMYQGPHKVIRKRYDKLLDYDSAAARQRNAGDHDQAKAMDEELTIARNNYEALNAQLLDDLPKLYAMSMEILLKCLKWLISIQNCFLRNAVDKLHTLLRLPLLLGTVNFPNIVEAFNIAHAIAVERISDLSFIPKSFNPQVNEMRKMKEQRSTIIDGVQKLIDIESGSNQCDGQRIQLKQKYPAEHLFWVCKDFVGPQTMDLTLSAGTLVAVIKEGDPMGNRDRWFVDNGAEKGFVCKEFLSNEQPLSAVALPVSMSQKTTDLLDWLDPVGPSESKSSLGLESDLLLPASVASCAQAFNPVTSKQNEWVTCDDDPLASVDWSNGSRSSSFNFSTNQYTDVSSDIFYRAIYEFTARSKIELNIRDGEIVRVLQKHDLDGSEEWWNVEREDGQSGYVPANYLYAFQFS